MKFYNRQYAFIVGISQYQKREYNLRTAEQDARELKQLLENEFNFDQVYVLYNEDATGSAIMDQMDWYAQNLDKDDGLFIYYGGHGRVDKEVGYLIPYDGDSNIFNRNNLFMTTLVPYFKNIIPARQIFFTIASCFSGEFLYTRSTEPETVLRDVVRQRQEKPQEYESRLSRITKEYTRQVLTAGSHDEQMIDNWPESKLSPFAQLMIDGLTESENYIEAEELAGYIRREMNRMVDKKIIPFHQTPQFADMTYKGKGCFVFQRKENITRPTSDEKLQNEMINNEKVRKYSIDDLLNCGILEEYIEKGGNVKGEEWFAFYEKIKMKFDIRDIKLLYELIQPIIEKPEFQNNDHINVDINNQVNMSNDININRKIYLDSIDDEPKLGKKEHQEYSIEKNVVNLDKFNIALAGKQVECPFCCEEYYTEITGAIKCKVCENQFKIDERYGVIGKKVECPYCCEGFYTEKTGAIKCKVCEEQFTIDERYKVIGKEVECPHCYEEFYIEKTGRVKCKECGMTFTVMKR